MIIESSTKIKGFSSTVVLVRGQDTADRCGRICPDTLRRVGTEGHLPRLAAGGGCSLPWLRAAPVGLSPAAAGRGWLRELCAVVGDVAAPQPLTLVSWF